MRTLPRRLCRSVDHFYVFMTVPSCRTNRSPPRRAPQSCTVNGNVRIPAGPFTYAPGGVLEYDDGAFIHFHCLRIVFVRAATVFGVGDGRRACRGRLVTSSAAAIRRVHNRCEGENLVRHCGVRVLVFLFVSRTARPLAFAVGLEVLFPTRALSALSPLPTMSLGG